MLFKPWVQSSFWISNQNFMKMWSIHPCHVWFLWLLQSWFPISYFQTMVYWFFVFFFQNICGNTRRSKYFYPLTHNTQWIFFLSYYHSFFTKFLLGDLFSGTIFWSSFGMESYGGGGSSRRGWYQMRGTWKKWPLRPKCLPMYYSTISVSFGVLRKIDLSMQFWAKKKSKLREKWG